MDKARKFTHKPIFNFQDYKVEYSDGSYHELTANQIAESMLS